MAKRTSPRLAKPKVYHCGNENEGEHIVDAKGMCDKEAEDKLYRSQGFAYHEGHLVDVVEYDRDVKETLRADLQLAWGILSVTIPHYPALLASFKKFINSTMSNEFWINEPTEEEVEKCQAKIMAKLAEL